MDLQLWKKCLSWIFKYWLMGWLYTCIKSLKRVCSRLTSVSVNESASLAALMWPVSLAASVCACATCWLFCILNICSWLWCKRRATSLPSQLSGGAGRPAFFDWKWWNMEKCFIFCFVFKTLQDYIWYNAEWSVNRKSEENVQSKLIMIIFSYLRLITVD